MCGTKLDRKMTARCPIQSRFLRLSGRRSIPSCTSRGTNSSLTILYVHGETGGQRGTFLPISRQKLLDLADKNPNHRRRAHKSLSTIGSLKKEKSAGTGSPTVHRELESRGAWSITPYSGILYVQVMIPQYFSDQDRGRCFFDR